MRIRVSYCVFVSTSDRYKMTNSFEKKLLRLFVFSANYNPYLEILTFEKFTFIIYLTTRPSPHIFHSIDSFLVGKY